jgi:Protein of unknown function (DUF2865)
MQFRLTFKLAVVVAGMATSGTALAQTAECQRYRAELASLGRGGNSGGAAQQQRIEIARLSGYFHSIGCGGGQAFFFGGPPPAECGAIAQRINMMQANYSRLVSEANTAGSDARRRQLVAAIQQTCNPLREAALRREAEERRMSDRDVSPPRGGRLVCVRSCDGSFFPLQNLPESGRSGADEMCQALCPGARTAAYAMPGGPDADLAQAVSLRGQAYVKLAGAFKFQKSFDPSCSCRKEGQSWAEALAKAEKMIERAPGDIIVTAKKAEELSRPKIRPGAKPPQGPDAPTALDVETTGSIKPARREKKAEAAGAPAGSEMSSSGPQPGAAEKTVAPAETNPDTTKAGAKPSIRVVGPTFISMPASAAE